MLVELNNRPETLFLLLKSTQIILGKHVELLR